MSISAAQQEMIRRFYKDRRLAHQTLFAHRHGDETPPFHLDIIDLWHSVAPRALMEAFRGAGKSTLAEEAIIIMACLREFRNGLILGENEARATERLTAIKHEFETNDRIEELFGPMVGPTWQERRIVLANGIIIQAFGRGQTLRGSKYLQHRPDLAFGDDMEDDESVATPEARRKFKNWFMKVVIPSLAPGYRMRVAGTPLDPEAWLLQLKQSPDWVSKTYPIEHKDPESGARAATWPSRYPLEKVDKIKAEFLEVGAATEYAQEYMCEAIDPQMRSFSSDMIVVNPNIQRTWQPVYAFFDPARTVKAGSDRTGVAVWSWVNNRLIVWAAYGGFWKPDDIIKEMFTVGETYDPVHIYVEETSLNEFIMQPIRAEMVKRGVVLPVKPIHAAKSKIDFITALQPFFRAGEIVFASEFPELRKEMLQFPTGLMDVLNALAYAPRLRAGQPVYDNFRIEHITEDMAVPQGPLWLALNATAQFTTAALVAMHHGRLAVLCDWVREGPPGDTLGDIAKEATLWAGRGAIMVAGPQHFALADAVGLRAAARAIPAEIRKSLAAVGGREVIRDHLRRQVHQQPAFRVATAARWTLHAFAGGYCRVVGKKGMLSDFAEDGPYKVLIEGLESFAALAAIQGRDDSDLNVRYTEGGQRYISSLPR